MGKGSRGKPRTAEVKNRISVSLKETLNKNKAIYNSN
jgi:hypothetical protein